MSARPFEIVCEIEPPVRPDLTHARHQIGVLTAVSSTFLIPDNHIGRATVSSIAVAHEVQAMGGHSIACINSRDRNLLGFRRDLLTAGNPWSRARRRLQHWPGPGAIAMPGRPRWVYRPRPAS